MVKGEPGIATGQKLEGRTVVVTGVSGFWGARVAAQLLSHPGLRVIGIDRRPPATLLPGLDFVKADVRNPLLCDLFRVEQVDTLVHLAFKTRRWRREQDFESNVLGAMQLVGACADAGVRHLVFKSTMAVYGARPDNPMYVGESWPLNARSAHGYVRDALEIERFLQTFTLEYPEMSLAVLRFGNIVGPEANTPFTQLLDLPLWPNLLGFDPLLQVIDADDAVAALVQAALAGFDGPVNVAAAGVVPFWKMAGMVGRPVLPILHPLVYGSWALLSGLPAGQRVLDWWPVEPDYLRFPWTGDLSRMREEMGFEPQLDASGAILRYVQARRAAHDHRPGDKDRYGGDRLEAVIAERRQAGASNA